MVYISKAASWISERMLALVYRAGLLRQKYGSIEVFAGKDDAALIKDAIELLELYKLAARRRVEQNVGQIFVRSWFNTHAFGGGKRRVFVNMHQERHKALNVALTLLYVASASHARKRLALPSFRKDSYSAVTVARAAVISPRHFVIWYAMSSGMSPEATREYLRWAERTILKAAHPKVSVYEE